MISCKCGQCLKIIRSNSRGIQCDACCHWFHLKCSLLSVKDHNHFSRTNDLWFCPSCRTNIFPFQELNFHELAQLSFNSNTECLCSSRIYNSKLASLPCFNVMTSINNNPNLSNIDIDQQSLVKLVYNS